MSYRGFKRLKSDTYTHKYTRTHTHTSGHQLKITFLDVLDYSEHSDTKDSKKKNFTKTFPMRKQMKERKCGSVKGNRHRGGVTNNKNEKKIICFK